MLELATLGVLLREPMHGYGLKSWLERYMGACITANFGAIYPLLKRIEEQGLIASEQDAGDRGMTRTTYSITDEGRRHWHSEMLAQPNESWVNSRSRFMTKYYFFGDLAAPERVLLLEQRLAACRQRLGDLPPLVDIQDMYQRDIKDYAAQLLCAEIGWLEMQLARERAGQPLAA